MEETARRRTQWESHYQRGETGWDRGGVSPALDHWFGNGNGQPCRVLVPGCGRGYEVAVLAGRGFEVTAVDIAPSAVCHLRDLLARVGSEARVVEADLLHWQAPEPFDAVYEQTCLCALDPATWPTYVDQVQRWLRPGGSVFAHFMQTGREGGPPFHCEVAAMRRLFAGPTWIWPVAAPLRIDHPNGLHEIGFRVVRRD
ncbi:MAG: methyltransferase domain-containing protein [Nitrospirota bacterium]|jgi:SAM-dependent methyltransferase